ncbi:hypothetical protein [Leptospira sp. GIMC2001]|uniref:hypothetical protein n=1 Tax=Leptospira sp. GIMC2001 TaxID=1513297 RepID=UPI00234BD99E|nr:hypothetical protein [Leptospira sp. GIMC2001]WCL49802.1 hypothetical protein O4O04_03005 [Leptospira sp. GIMC2001]
MRNLFLPNLLFILFFAVQCSTVQVVPQQPHPKDRVEKIIPGESYVEEPEKVEPALIKFMREDLEKASDLIENLIKGKKNSESITPAKDKLKKQEFEELEPLPKN